MKKVVISNRKALSGKYGAGGLTKILGQLDRLVAADAARGLQTRIVFLDDASLGSFRVAKAGNERAVKNAVDHVYLGDGRPDYILLLGSPDVVPHQNLDNPVPKDEDPAVPSDLPYACDAAYSKDPSKFTAPSRVVGRLPDVENGGAGDMDAFLALLKSAAEWRPTPSKDFNGAWFGLSAKVWKGSTSLSLSQLFGSAAGMHTSPKDGPSWKPKELAPRAHFINCHGAPVDPAFYGQEGQRYPEAIRSDGLAGVLSGAVVAAECCYGVQLYDPKSAPPGPTCSAYLAMGAFGFLGSTTIAYGPADGNGSADYICQFFLAEVVASGSMGTAFLRARQKFVKQESTIDPVILKTLAQFLLLGDPSIRAVGTPAVPEAKAAFARQTQKHKVRQVEVRKEAKTLSSALAVTETKGRRPTSDVRGRLETMAREQGFASPAITSHRVQRAASATIRAKVFGKGIGVTAFHVILQDEATSEPGTKAFSRARGPEAQGPRIARKKVVVVKQVGPSLSIVQTLVSR